MTTDGAVLASRDVADGLRDHRGGLGSLRVGQPLQARHADRRRAVGREVRQQPVGLQHRLEQRRAEHRRGVAADAEEGVPQQDPQQRPGVPRRLLAELHQARDSRSSAANYGTNPGRSRAASRTVNTGTPFLGSESGSQVYPVLLRDTNRLFPSAFPSAISYPFTPANNESIDIHYPDWPVPSTHQYSFGFQRALGKSMALEVRYVGNTNTGGWTSWNMNSSAQWSMLKGENGFYDEFRLAQQNLRANIAAGKGNTFAYTGAAGTNAAADLHGVPPGDPARRRAEPGAGELHGVAVRVVLLVQLAEHVFPGADDHLGHGVERVAAGWLMANAAKAGLPVNFFMANPALKNGGAYLETSVGNTRYNGLQIDLRRQMSKGLLVQGSYSYAFGRKDFAQRSLREEWFYVDSTGGPDHAFKVNWAYELPFGQGKRLGRQRRAVEGSVDRRLGDRRRRAHPERREVQLRRLPPGGHVREGIPGHVQVLPHPGFDRRKTASTCCPRT